MRGVHCIQNGLVSFMGSECPLWVPCITPFWRAVRFQYHTVSCGAVCDDHHKGRGDCNRHCTDDNLHHRNVRPRLRGKGVLVAFCVRLGATASLSDTLPKCEHTECVPAHRVCCQRRPGNVTTVGKVSGCMEFSIVPRNSVEVWMTETHGMMGGWAATGEEGGYGAGHVP